MLLEPQETPYDIRFKLFGIPVRIHPMFWLFSAILGWSALERGFEFVLAWIVCVFVSILIHELGHVFMGIAFGTHGSIVLYSFGGLAIGSNALGAWWKRVLVSFAGPLAGFIFLALLLLGMYLVEPGYFYYHVAYIAAIFQIPVNVGGLLVVRHEWPELLEFAMRQLVFINLFWGLVNLLPIWPLDGGQISRDLATRASHERGLQISLGISFLTAALFAINALVAMRAEKPLIPFLPTGGWWTVIMFGLLALESYMMLQHVSSRSYYDPNDPWHGQGRPWER